jgi:hypothetical protein
VGGFFGFSRHDEVLQRPAPTIDDTTRALIAEVCSKAGLVWVRPSVEDRFHPAWHVWHEDALHVVSGIGEQLLPTLNGPVDVLAPSKETGARILTFSAWGTPLEPQSAAWEAAADALRRVRLNATEPDEQRGRWASGTVITRIEPISVLGSGSGTDADPSGALAPARTPATTTGRRPWHLRSRSRGRVRLRGRRGQDG